MIEKQFKNLDEQIEIFKHKGMIINDERYVKIRYINTGYEEIVKLEYVFNTTIDKQQYEINLILIME